jgi:hypothetical protein
MFKHDHGQNFTPIVINNNSNNDHLNDIINVQLYDYTRVSSLFDEVILINNIFQVFASLALCIVGLTGALLNIGLLFRRPFSRIIFVEILLDSCHLINTLFTHAIILVVYIQTSADIDVHCPLSTFIFSLASFLSIIFLSQEAFNRYMHSFKIKSYYRSLAYRLILIIFMSLDIFVIFTLFFL